MQTLRSFLGLVKHFSHLPGMWAHLSSPLGHQPHGHRDAGPPCPRPVAHLPCLLGTAQGGLSPGPEQVVTRTTQNKPGPHLGHPPLNSLAGQDLGTVTGRPDNPLREPPDKSQVKSTELPGGGGRLEFTPPAPSPQRANEECPARVQAARSQISVLCNSMPHGDQGMVLPSLANKRALGSSGLAEKVPGRATTAGTRPFCPHPAPAPAPAQCLHLPLRCCVDRRRASGAPGHWEVGSGCRSVPCLCTWSSGGLWSLPPS